MRLTYHVTENVSRGEVQRWEGREGGGEGSSGMQDTVKLPAESPIPRGVGGRRNGLCPLRALGTTVQAGICLVSLFMRSNIVIWHRTGEFSVPCGR